MSLSISFLARAYSVVVRGPSRTSRAVRRRRPVCKPVSPVRASAFHMSSSDCRQCCMVDLDWLTGRPVIVKQSKIFNGDSDTSAAARKFCCCFCQAGQELQPSDLVARIALSIAFGILQCFVRCLLDRSCRQDRIRHGSNFPNWCRFNIRRSAKHSDGPMHARPQRRPPWDHPPPRGAPPTMRPSHEGADHTPGVHGSFPPLPRVAGLVPPDVSLATNVPKGAPHHLTR